MISLAGYDSTGTPPAYISLGWGRVEAADGHGADGDPACQRACCCRIVAAVRPRHRPHRRDARAALRPGFGPAAGFRRYPARRTPHRSSLAQLERYRFTTNDVQVMEPA